MGNSTKMYVLFCGLMVTFGVLAQSQLNSIVSATYEVDQDSTDYFRLSLSHRVASETWIGLSASRANAEGPGFSANSKLISGYISHDINAWSIAAGLDYWQAASNELETKDGWLSVDYSLGNWTLGAEYIYRDIRVEFTVPTNGRMLTDDVRGDGFGLLVAYDFDEDWRIYLGGKRYDYSGQFVSRPEFRVFSQLFFAADDSVLNQSYSAGVDYHLKNYTFGFSASQNRSAFDDVTTRIYQGHFSFPLSATTDLRLGIGRTSPDLESGTTFGGLTLIWFR